MQALADAVVVGGGIAGASLAAALGRWLPRVVLLEADECGKLASAKGFAWVNASSKWTDREYHNLNAEGCRYHRQLATEWGSDRTGWQGGGTLCWTAPDDPSGAERLRRHVEALACWEYPLTALSGAEMATLEPWTVFPSEAVGCFFPSEGWLDTAVFMQFLLNKARQHGVEIWEDTPSLEMTRDHTGAIATVNTPRGRISTRLLFLAAGTATGKLAELAGGPALPARLEIGWSPGLLLETPPLTEPFNIHRVCLPPDAHGLHLRPTSAGGVLAGADDTDALAAESLAGGNEDVDNKTYAAVKASLLLRLEKVFGTLPRDASGATLRLCRRPMPADGLPIVGPLPGVPGVYVLVTHSGITLAPLLAKRLVADALSGNECPELAAYRPDRFVR